MNREQANAFFKEHGIRYVLAQFVDIHGSAKAKAVPVEHLDMVLGDGAGFAGFALWGFGMGPEGPDYMAVGELATLQNIPWMPGYARLICNGVVSPSSCCSGAVPTGLSDPRIPRTISTSRAMTTRGCTAPATRSMRW
jgi:glutamine synthetase